MIHISFTDQWQTLLDENGKPLIGRVKFFNADSTQYKSIYYDIQGETQGENPQYTLQDGRLEHQVFIGSGVYTCRVEKFLGTDELTKARIDYEEALEGMIDIMLKGIETE